MTAAQETQIQEAVKLYSTRLQYGKFINAKNCKGTYISCEELELFVYLWLMHVDVWQKPTQY